MTLVTEPRTVSSPQPDDDQEQPRLPRRALLAASAGTVVLVAGLAVVGLRDDSPPVPVQGAGEGAASAPAVPEPELPTAIPTEAPADVTWQLFRGLAVPSSPTAGPRVVDGDLAEGFARTPEGALMAVLNLPARSFLGTEWRRVTERMVLPGPGRGRQLALRGSLPDDVPSGDLAQVAGFRFVTYSPDVAVIEVAARGFTGQQQVATATVRWRDGDWRLELPEGGTYGTPLDSLAGFVPFSGVS
jgi:hypothetical protein